MQGITKHLKIYNIPYEVKKVPTKDFLGRKTTIRKAIIERHHVEKLLECLKNDKYHPSRVTFIKRIEKWLRENK